MVGVVKEEWLSEVLGGDRMIGEDAVVFLEAAVNTRLLWVNAGQGVAAIARDLQRLDPDPRHAPDRRVFLMRLNLRPISMIRALLYLISLVASVYARVNLDQTTQATIECNTIKECSVLLRHIIASSTRGC